MRHRRFRMHSLVFLILIGTNLVFCQNSAPSVKELVKKNIKAAGGEERLTQVNNYSFKVGSRMYYLSSDGQMKIMTEGRKPVITETILVNQKEAKRNCYNNAMEIEGLEKTTHQFLALLYSGLFTLAKFEDRLHFHGLKSFGPMRHYALMVNIDDLAVYFYLDSEDYTLKRIVFSGHDKEGDKYEINQDFGPFQEVEGIKIPSSWFSSRVGTRGQLHEVSDVKFNQSLDKDFFSRSDVNVGDVKITDGILSGSVIDFVFRRSMLMIGTNWTGQCIQRAGFKDKDKLILQVADQEIEIDFYQSQPPRSAFGQGAKIMAPNRRDENYLIYLFSSEYKELEEKLSPLLPIRIKRK